MSAKNNKKFMERLLKGPGAVLETRNVHADVVDSPSPGLNFTFGNGQGCPTGYSVLLYGPPRGGKSIICSAMTGAVHQADPDAFVVKYNTEFREDAQLDEAQRKVWGIDTNRYIGYDRNDPEIFDHIEKDLAANCQDGMKLKLVIIDSINMIQGRRSMNADSVMQQQVGDNAATIQEGLRRILPIQRKHRFALILTSHIRSVMDKKAANSTNVYMTHDTAVRPAVSWAVQHHCEYYMFVNPAGGADGKKDLLGNEFKSDAMEDMYGNADRTGHKVRVRMMDSTIGPKGRNAEFTLDYKRGIINVHEEVFQLGVSCGIITKPNNVMHEFGGRSWKGKEAMIQALKEDTQLQKAILQELKARDLAGFYANVAAAPTQEEKDASGLTFE
jgi:RecA/RadA recombinase